MPDPLTWMILIGSAFVGSIVGGVAGFGAGVVLLPVAAWTLGIRMAVPVLTITMLLGNMSRLWWSRGETDRQVTLRFLLGAVPGTALGTTIFVAASSDSLSRVIGSFLLASVPLRRVLMMGHWRVRLAHFPLLGVVFGVLSSTARRHRRGADTVLPGLRATPGCLHRYRGGLCLLHARH